MYRYNNVYLHFLQLVLPLQVLHDNYLSVGGPRSSQPPPTGTNRSANPGVDGGSLQRSRRRGGNEEAGGGRRSFSDADLQQQAPLDGSELYTTIGPDGTVQYSSTQQLTND